MSRLSYPAVLGRCVTNVVEPFVGTRYLSVARWLDGYWKWSESQRAAWQHERLTDILGYACTNVPRYRSFAVRGDRPLVLFPTTDKAAIRDDLPSHLSSTSTRRTLAKKTGGTSGDPWQYELDIAAWSHWYGAQIHFFERAGHQYGDSKLLLGAPTSLGLSALTWKKRVRLALERKDVSLTGFDINQEPSLTRAKRATNAEASLWYGYAGVIAAMADAVLDEGMTLPGPPVIVTMAEKLQPNWRARIEKAFGSGVVEEYGCNDGGVIAHSCTEGLLHVAENVSVLEILDGDRPCARGEEGEVVVTNLHTRTMPFIRYRIGDRAVLGPQHCPCGVPGMTLVSVNGRQADSVHLADGAVMYFATFTEVFKETPGVLRWQVVQPTPDQIVVRVHGNDQFDRRQEDMIVDYVRRQTLGKAHVRLTTTEPIEKSAGGKIRLVVRRFD